MNANHPDDCTCDLANGVLVTDLLSGDNPRPLQPRYEQQPTVAHHLPPSDDLAHGHLIRAVVTAGGGAVAAATRRVLGSH